MFTGFVFNSFCCLSASVFSCAFGSVFTYVMFLFPVVLFAVSFLDTVSAYFPTCVR